MDIDSFVLAYNECYRRGESYSSLADLLQISKREVFDIAYRLRKECEKTGSKCPLLGRLTKQGRISDFVRSQTKGLQQ